MAIALYQEITLAGTDLTTTLFGLLAAGILWAGGVLFLVGFSTGYWGYVHINNQYWVYYGLWKQCDTFHNTCTSQVGNDGVSGLVVAAQSFAILAIICILIASGNAAAYLFYKRFNRDKRVALSLMLTSLSSALFTLVACILYADGFFTDMHKTFPDSLPENLNVIYSLDYSYVLTLISSVVFFLSAFLSIADLWTQRNGIPL